MTSTRGLTFTTTVWVIVRVHYNTTGLRAYATYTPDFVTALGRYRSDGSDPSQQPWQGSVTVTSADADLFAGTFEFTAYDYLDAGPVRPLVNVTNGVFSIDYR